VTNLLELLVRGCSLDDFSVDGVDELLVGFVLLVSLAVDKSLEAGIKVLGDLVLFCNSLSGSFAVDQLLLLVESSADSVDDLVATGLSVDQSLARSDVLGFSL